MLGEGTFSVVFKAQSVSKGDFYAVKCMKSYYSSFE
jgi:serine/threonine protein kinase